MSKIILHLPQRKARIEYRASKPVLSRFKVTLSNSRKSNQAEGFLFTLAQIRKIRNGNKASRVVRHFVDRFNIKAILGGNITLMVIAAGVATPGSNTTVLAQAQAEAQVLPAAETHITTEFNLRYPMDKFSFNQGFSYFHPGIDLGDPIGTPVYPVANGTVISTEYGRFGYGNSIVIQHKNGLKSRYAHLNRIDVRPEDPVTTDMQIGQVGNTGRSTGPHLHLEIRTESDVPLNPVSILGPVPATK